MPNTKVPSTNRLTTIRLAKEYLKFSAAHFTIFSAQERERLHGHNFLVSAEIDAAADDNGMCFNYGLFKNLIEECCQELDEYLLIPELSPHLQISEENNNYRVEFNGEIMLFLKSDTRLLPVKNSTVEEYSYYLLQRLLTLEPNFSQFDIRRIEISVSSGPGQSGSSEWLAQ